MYAWNPMAQSKSRKPSGKEEPTGFKMVAQNRKARYRYHLEDPVEAGLALLGTEVKSLRAGGGSIAEAFGRVRDGEAWLLNANIPPYAMRGYADHEPKRPRKLLLHRKEIRRIQKALEEKGYTLVPLSLYFNARGVAKVKIALARGKRMGDRREDVKKRDAKREVEREMARSRKGR